MALLSLIISFVIAIAILALVYWAITKILAASGIPIPPVVMAVIQIVFVIIAVLTVLKYLGPAVGIAPIQ